MFLGHWKYDYDRSSIQFPIRWLLVTDSIRLGSQLGIGKTNGMIRVQKRRNQKSDWKPLKLGTDSIPITGPNLIRFYPKIILTAATDHSHPHSMSTYRYAGYETWSRLASHEIEIYWAHDLVHSLDMVCRWSWFSWSQSLERPTKQKKEKSLELSSKFRECTSSLVIYCGQTGS